MPGRGPVAQVGAYASALSSPAGAGGLPGLAHPHGSPESAVQVLDQDLGSLQPDGEADGTGSDTASEPLRRGTPACVIEARCLQQPFRLGADDCPDAFASFPRLSRDLAGEPSGPGSPSLRSPGRGRHTRGRAGTYFTRRTGQRERMPTL
jgi:hypothetical protein